MTTRRLLALAISCCAIIAQGLLIGAKLSGAITWPWWAVLLPVELAALFAFLVAVFVCALVLTLGKWRDGEP